jgi:hypothetical protein
MERQGMNKIIADRKPLVSEVSGWTRTFHQEGVCVYEADNYEDYYKCTVGDSRPKYFFGETAWMDVQRYALDNLPTFH